MNSLRRFIEESPDIKTIPSNYAYSTNPQDFIASDPDHETIPAIDFSLLTSKDPVIRSQVLEELHKACTDWGCFQVINHGIPETSLKMLIEKTLEFFNLDEAEKKDYQETDFFNPIRYGSGYNLNKYKGISYWRDYLKLFLHPDFHCPNKPLGLSELFFEYAKRTREVSRELINGMSTNLGLDNAYVEKALDLDQCLQICVVNLYPRCPQPQLAIGLPPHTDHGLFTFLINNGVPGYEIMHKGKWIKIQSTLPNSLLVQTADHLEIFSNGKYKSLEHRAILNNAAAKISVNVAYGPSLNAVVAPADKLVDKEKCPAAYVAMNYKEYIKMQQRGQLFHCLDRVRI
uniref:2-oxoglutarate-dependent dioxygenase 19-like n=1 Tax=Erigeron canadensis TaxID=72917 RepID=UPI001CB96546|nr:2-oxoglutarate-dependent dioxygenase 19-like [Erigeron canadensis]